MLQCGWRGETVVATDTSWVEVRDAAKHPTKHKSDPHNKELSTQNVSITEVEKFCAKKIAKEP